MNAPEPREPVIEIQGVICEKCDRPLTLSEERGWWLDSDGGLLCEASGARGYIHAPVRLGEVR